MKTIHRLMIALALLTASASCQKEESITVMSPELVGEWHLSSTETDSIQINPLTDVYLIINADCTFEIYQKSCDQTRYTKFTGVCKTEGNKLSGIYSDGNPWGSEYSYTVTETSLTLISENSVEVQLYIKENLDEKLKNEADVKAKSELTDIQPYL